MIVSHRRKKRELIWELWSLSPHHTSFFPSTTWLGVKMNDSKGISTKSYHIVQMSAWRSVRLRSYEKPSASSYWEKSVRHHELTQIAPAPPGPQKKADVCDIAKRPFRKNEIDLVCSSRQFNWTSTFSQFFADQFYPQIANSRLRRVFQASFPNSLSKIVIPYLKKSKL
jgi:hypothetical protein